MHIQLNQMMYNADEIVVYNTDEEIFKYEGPASVGVEPDVTIDRK